MSGSARTDDQLSHAFAQRASDAFDEAYRRHASVLEAVARSVIGGDEARDCVHDALLRVWRTRAYRPQRGALRSFLIVCVRNEALSRRRAAARQYAVAAREAQLTANVESATSVPDHVQRARLYEALAALSPEQRTVIELAYFTGRSQTQIAAALDLPLGTVKSRASLALRRLALAIGPDNA